MPLSHIIDLRTVKQTSTRGAAVAEDVHMELEQSHPVSGFV